MRFLEQIVKKFSVDLGDPARTERMLQTQRELVAILFAVVLGLGFEKFRLDGFFSLNVIASNLLLIAVYFTIVMSWWGWNFGRIAGTETNYVCFWLDGLIALVYWLMIKYAANPATLPILLYLYVAIYILYALWEAVRFYDTPIPEKQEKYSKSAHVNRAFLAIFTVLAVFVSISYYLKPHNTVHLWIQNHTSWVSIGIAVLLTLLIFAYRKAIKGKLDPTRQRKYRTEPEERYQQLIARAKEASALAEVHLSNYPVGAAILTKSGGVYTGCNIEFDNYSNTIHAEEAAICSMVGSGDSEPVAIAIYTPGEEPSFPCGMCRQSLFELGGSELTVIATTDTKTRQAKMGAIFTDAFKLQ